MGKFSPQQQTLLLAETAIMECRFLDAYPLLVILHLLRTYIETIDSFSKNYICNTDVGYQAFPLTCVMIGYSRLAREHFLLKDYSYSHAVFMGLTNTQIAEKLEVSKYTVKHRISAICEKLGVKNKQELMEYLHKNS